MESVQTILSKMTTEEKVKLVNGASFFGMYENRELSIPRMQFLDGGTGINFEQLFGDYAQTEQLFFEATNGMTTGMALLHVINHFYEPQLLTKEEQTLRETMKAILDEKTHMPDYAPACFPAGISLGSTWNEKVVYEVGKALGLEANVYQVNVLLGTPNVNLLRDPRNGRIFEGYSEDPYLVKKLAPGMVKGVQEQGVVANVKHFAANNQETNRVGIDETISRRALEELYLPGFQACVQEGNCRSVMSAYNKINGVLCTENEWLLSEKLRNEWGFEGFVVSDWDAVKHDDKALAAGNDLAMPGPRKEDAIKNALENGTLSMEVLDQSVLRLLSMIKWVLQNKKEPVKDANYLSALTKKAAYDAAIEGMVLLKNENILPLKPNTKIALWGEAPQNLLACGTGSAGITTNRIVSFVDCLKETFSMKDIPINEVTEETEVILYVIKELGMEGNDRKTIALSEKDVENLNTLTRPAILILNTCGPVIFEGINQEKVQGIFQLFLPGMEAARALSDLLVGKQSPSGKLPITFPKRMEDMPTFFNFPGDGYQVTYGEGIFLGYRYYDTAKIQPAYPFGYGLSYTKFEVYEFERKDELTFTAKVKNVGDCDGAEVLQLYISDVESTLRKPIKELKAFQKIWLQMGQMKEVTFQLKTEDFASYDGDFMEFVTEEGYYDVLLSTSSAMEDVKGCIRIYLDVDSKYRYGLDSTIRTLYEHKKLRDLLFAFWDSCQYDPGILYSVYQYTASQTLREIMPLDAPREKVDDFLKKVSLVKKI